MKRAIYLLFPVLFICCKPDSSNHKGNSSTISASLKSENENVEYRLNQVVNNVGIDEKVISKQRTQVYIPNLETFFSALGNHKELILTMDTLDLSLSNIQSYLKQSEHYNTSFQTEKLLVNNQLVLSNFENLCIKSAKQTHIVVDNRHQTLLTFHNSEQIELNNLKLFHIPTDYCKGDVLVFLNSKEIKINNCELYGSGSVGLKLDQVSHLKLDNSRLFNNSKHALSFNRSKDIRINQSYLYDNIGSALISMTDSECKISNSSFSGNISSRFYLGQINTQSNALYYENCHFNNNSFESGLDDFELMKQNENLWPSWYTEEGMVHSYFQAENSRNIDKILSVYANNLDFYYDLAIVGDRKTELIEAYQSSWDKLMFSKNDILKVKSEFNRNPQAINVFSFVKNKDPYTIYRVKNKIELSLGQQGEEPQLTNEYGLYEHLNKVNNVILLESTKLKPLNINFTEVVDIENKEIETILNAYKDITYQTILESYFNNYSFKKAIKLIHNNRDFEQQTLVQFRQSSHTSKNDHQQIINYISAWSESINQLSWRWDNTEL